MLKNITQFECFVSEKIGRFYIDSDTPIPVVKEMIFQFQKYIGQIEDSIKMQQETAQKATQERLNQEKAPEVNVEVPVEDKIEQIG